MKAVSNKNESKKRKRDDTQEPISESPKKAKVHAQRKFAQGAAFNSSVITPIKDKVRPTASTPISGPMLTRTSILPPKLDFFKDAIGSEPEASTPADKSDSSFTNHKSNSDQSGGTPASNKKQNSKKNEKNHESKKSQTPAVQALRKKYQEQRLAKQKVTNVTKLAQKVKGKNMVRTRSSAIVEDTKPTVKKQIPGKENKANPSGLRSGLKRIQPVSNKSKAVKPKHFRAGLRSSGIAKIPEKVSPQHKPTAASTKKAEKESKKAKVEVPEVKTKNMKVKKMDGFSDFSSDDNEPLLNVKKPKMVGRKSAPGAMIGLGKGEKKTFVKTRSQINELGSTRVSIRPTRKTKEAAAIYMEMITKKLVSPEKSGDDDVSSVDSFPELPNAKRNEQRETEIRAKALASKKVEPKQQVEDKAKDVKKIVLKKNAEQTPKSDVKTVKEETTKKINQNLKKEVKGKAKQEKSIVGGKKANKSPVKETPSKAKVVEEKKEQVSRPSTRSRHHEELETTPSVKKVNVKNLPSKTLKVTLNKDVEKQQVNDKITQSGKKTKAKSDVKLQKNEASSPKVSGSGNAPEQTGSKEQAKGTKKNSEKGGQKISQKKEVKEKQENVKEASAKKGKKAAEAKAEENETEEKKKKEGEKKAEKKTAEVTTEGSNSVNKRPIRKCSTADKIWIDIDGFTSDEEDFVDVSPVTKTRASAKKAGLITEKPKPKLEQEKKSNKSETTTTAKTKSKNEKIKESEKETKEEIKNEEVKKEKETKEEEKKVEGKKAKAQTKAVPNESGTKTSVKATKAEVDSKTKGNAETKATKIEDEIKEEEKKTENHETNRTVPRRTKVSQVDKKVKENSQAKRSETTDVKGGSGKDCDQTTSKVAVDEGVKSSSESKETVGQDPSATKVLGNQKTIEQESKGGGNKSVEADAKKKKEQAGKEEKTKNSKSETGLKLGQKRSLKAIGGKSEKPRNLREREASAREEDESESFSKSYKRTRPVRQCSTGEKKWIETDSDFSFYETSDDEDNLPILDFSGKSKEKPSPVDAKEIRISGEDAKEKTPVKVTTEEEKIRRLGDPCSDNFSESDEEPLKKKALMEENACLKPPEAKITKPEMLEIKTPGKAQREMPGLHPLKKIPSESQLRGPEIVNLPLRVKSGKAESAHEPSICVPGSSGMKTVFPEPKNFNERSEVSGVRQTFTKEREISDFCDKFFMEQRESPVVSVPNRIEMILNSLKRDTKVVEGPCNYSNDVKVTFGTVPYQPMPHSSQIPCTFQVKPVSFMPSREPISTHGLDLLSEVAIPTTPNEKLSSQTERIEKWLKDSLAADQKKSFSTYEEVDYKSRDQGNKLVLEKPQPEPSLYYVPGSAKITSHPEVQKFGQMELLESQKLLKRNIFAAEVKQDASRVEQPSAPKKTLTSVQDLLKLQKERKDVPKSPADNSPHSKNCKCNNCIVKKGWFKNKPVPKIDLHKSSPVEDCDESAKPFQSLTKAFTKISGDGKNSKVSASIAPIVVSPPTALLPSPRGTSSPFTKEASEKKGVFQQRKLSFLERMKERERKEAAAAAAKPSPNAFSPNNESSVYAFEPEPERPTVSNAPFRSKTRESRTSSTNASKSDEEISKLEEESSATVSSGTQLDKTTQEGKESSKASQSASIAVQVNLDSEAVTEVETVSEIQDGKSIEISTQTEVPEEDSDSPMFYIPLQQARAAGASGSSDQHLIQGVALKLGTEGPMGPNQRVIMKAKLVTKPPDTPSRKAVVMPQPKRIFDQKSNNPPIGTVQPTTRKPPEVAHEEVDGNSTGESDPLPSSKCSMPSTKSDASAEPISQASTDSGMGSESFSSKTSRNSPAIFSGKSSKNKEKTPQSTGKDKPEVGEELPSSASSSKSKRTMKQKSSESVINPTNSTWLPPAGTPSKLVEAPTFHPTEKDFQDPFEFFDRIRPAAEKFGLCRIVPPSNFKPDCKVSDDMRFTAYNQYVHRMFHRWGPNIKEMMAIKKYLTTQSISLKQPPWIGGIEVDLPRLYQSVQNCGGLMKVMEKKKWHQVADMMKIPKAAQDRVTKLDDIYCKYLLPYDTLSHDERQKLFDEVEKDWSERQQQQQASAESQDSQGDEEAEEENYIEECEECIVKGKNMALNQFYRIARNTMTMWFKSPEPSPREVENEFWKHVSERNHHVCVHSGSIDSSGWGYGFPIAKNNSFSKHPWNLKVLTNNSGSVLRSLGPVMGVTVPTLHVGMVFTAFCWYRDPHGLPWIEYLHTGAPKIWYGISDDNSNVFQEALTKLAPRYIKNKTIWLPSDTAMIPPDLLVEHGVSLCHTVQEPGQFILVFPRAFTSSICTGYLVSESVYFAQPSWLTSAEQVFKDIQESCEPSMFSLEKLLFSIATDSRSSVEVLRQVLPMVWHVRQKEIDGRKTLFNLGLKTSERLPSREFGNKKRKGRWTQEEDGDYECEICRTNLYVSLVTNSHEEGVYCLPHAIDLLTQKRHQLKYCKLMYTYTQEEMNELVEKLEQKIESKSQKKLQSKSSTSAK